MKKSLLFIAMFFVAVFVTAQTDLFFSEYVEGSGNNKAVEIYNPTNQAIDLTNYWVVRYSNGETTFTSGGITQLTGTLEPYKTFVLVNGQTTSTPTSPACDPILQAMADQLDHDYPAPTYMNGNDAIALLKTPNGEPPLENGTNVKSVDLIGQVGLGAAISAETGWSYVKDSTITYSNSAGEPVTGKVINYIVQKRATNGSDFGPFWMSWTSDHSLIRKPEVVEGVIKNPEPFKVSQEWDTVPGQIDPITGHIVYKDIWDNLG
ncbi:MAG TPA: lamin tail domain-containing protein [Bacteroidales bacterium]|nr:lamin tail domain-containing protein [Bacteroidales bacterium]